MTMGDPKFTTVHCSVCGRVIGKKQGVQVVLGLVCEDPVCNFQEPPALNQPRDAAIVSGHLAGIPVVQISCASGMSRQRIYQIIDAWKKGA